MTLAPAPPWLPPDAGDSLESGDTLKIPVEDCYVVSTDTPDYVRLIEEQKPGCERGLPGEKLLHDVVERIEQSAPLEVDGETRRLLDAAIQYQETGSSDDLEGWASRLADDVKDADD